MKWIGLTGGIATGKSAAKKILQDLGYPVIDADQIAHQISQPGQPGFEKIKQFYGPDIFTADGFIDRKKLGEIIFTSEEKKLQLEGLLHPIIQAEVLNQRQQFEKAGHAICFYDVPLLFEKNLQAQFDCTILIWCDFQTQLDRLVARNKLTQQQALDRIQSQLLMADKLPLATYCIDNSTSLDSLKLQLTSLLQTKIKVVSV